jgi:hypothetical protein
MHHGVPLWTPDPSRGYAPAREVGTVTLAGFLIVLGSAQGLALIGAMALCRAGHDPDDDLDFEH